MNDIIPKGTVINERYRVERMLGQGGMGAVYEGRHVFVGKPVAIKILHSKFTDDKNIIKRFFREAQAAAAIGHKNIIDVFDVGVSENSEPYLVMELLEGESLGDMLTRVGTVDLPAACAIMEPALLALQAAHEKGIIHRDLKPDNIFIVHNKDEPPSVKLIDFGISKFTDNTGMSQLTVTGSLLGTPAFMSPEQVRGDKDIDLRSDIYSIGVILFQMLTGHLPFGGDHYNELIINVLTASPPTPTEIHAKFPVEAEQLVLATLSKDAADRPQDAMELLEKLRATSEYAARQERLIHFTTGITKRSFAGGYLGETRNVEDPTDNPSDVLSELSGRTTMPKWTVTAPAKPGRVNKLILGGVAIAAVVALAAFFLFPRSPNATQTPAPAAAAEPADPSAATANLPPLISGKDSQGVTITIEGAPEGAKVSYSGMPVPMNPFRVDKTETLKAIRVEAEGFQPFVTSVVPKTDLTVAVNLVKPEPVPEPVAKPAKRTRKPTRKPRPKPQKAPEPKDNDFSEGKRGTKFGTEFE